MKVGDYVRTKKGIIGKLEKEQRTGHSDWIIDTLYYNDDEMINRLVCSIVNYDIVKSSPNIIDLIEVGDYVNGYKVIDIAQAPIRALYLEDISQRGALIPRINKDIKSIVTKEQFESMEYKVGD